MLAFHYNDFIDNSRILWALKQHRHPETLENTLAKRAVDGTIHLTPSNGDAWRAMKAREGSDDADKSSWDSYLWAWWHYKYITYPSIHDLRDSIVRRPGFPGMDTTPHFLARAERLK